jgi:hypothetical protein
MPMLGAGIALLVLGVPLAGQSPASRPASSVPRTTDGRPDLQGVWNYATLTPMERPDGVSSKGTLTDAEAVEFEAQTLRRQNRDFNVPAGNVGDYNNFWYDRGTNIVKSKRTSLVIDPADGRIPALTAAAQERQTKFAEARRGIGLDEPTPRGFVEDLGPGQFRVRCVLGSHSGPPITPGAYNNHIQIVQAPGHVALVDEQIHTTRIVPLDGRPHGSNRRWVGDSRGRWEGDTLVIETKNFRPETQFDTRLRYSANLHVIERLTRVDADTLLYRATIDDPDTWTSPWTYEVPMTRTTEHMYEYACHEGNYGIVNILAGARERERATGPER